MHVSRRVEFIEVVSRSRRPRDPNRSATILNMLSIADVSPSDRFLMIASRVSTSRWNDECASVRSWLGTKPPTISAEAADQMLQTMNAPLPSDATPLVIIHCYADVPVGTQYHVAFDPNDTEINELTHAEVLFGVVMSRAVERNLSHGWHQTAVLRFFTGMPKLFNQLSIDSISSHYLCMCSQADFPEIKRSLKKAAEPSGEREPPMTRVLKS